MGSSQPGRAANQTHPSCSCVPLIINFMGDARGQTGKIRQTHLWEKGRPLPDLSPYEQRLAERLKPLIRRDEV